MTDGEISVERALELQAINDKMHELGIVGLVQPSTRKTKRWSILTPGSKKKIFFGDPNRDNYLIHKDDERRAKFLNRFKNAKNKDNPTKGIYYSIRLLW